MSAHERKYEIKPKEFPYPPNVTNLLTHHFAICPVVVESAIMMPMKETKKSDDVIENFLEKFSDNCGANQIPIICHQFVELLLRMMRHSILFN